MTSDLQAAIDVRGHLHSWVTAFVLEHMSDAERLAAEIGHGATAYEVLAVSGEESGFGRREIATSHGNFFGIHSSSASRSEYFPGQVGVYEAKKTVHKKHHVYIATYNPSTGFYQSGLRLVAKLKPHSANLNLSNPVTFFSLAHAHGWGVGNSLYMRQVEGAYLDVLLSAAEIRE